MEKTYNKGAIGLLMVMGVGFLALAGVLVMSEGVLSGLVTGQNTTATVRAFYASESVTQEGVSRYLKDVGDGNATSSMVTLSSNLSFCNGTQPEDITITPIPGTYRFTVKGEAESNKALRKVVKTMTSYPAGEAFSHALYSAGSGLTVSGNLTVSGDVYSYGQLNVVGSAKVEGDAFSSSETITTQNDDSVEGETITNYNHVYPPQPDYDGLKEMASSTGTYFTSDTDAQTCINNGNCDNKVVYIDMASGADIKINPGKVFTGSIITTGSITIKGGTYVAETNFPAIVAGGDLDILGGTKIEGLIIAEGDVKIFPGNTDIKGAILFTSGSGNLTANGTVKIEFNSESFANITDFVGLGFDSTDVSSIMPLSWHEE